MRLEPQNNLLLVIDTDQYAGNFERELCSYITGCYGDCGVDINLTKTFSNKYGFTMDEVVVSVPDKHGCYRPATIFKSKDGAMNSVAIMLSERPKQEWLNIIIERAKEFCDNPQSLAVHSDRMKYAHKRINILGIRLVQEKVIRKTIERFV